MTPFLWLRASCRGIYMFVATVAALLPLTAQAIINGASVEDGTEIAQSTVALLYSGQEFCSGTLIDKDLVLTAAHCLTEVAPDEISFGSTVFYKSSRRKVLGYRATEDYESLSSKDRDRDDIGLVRFEGGIPSGFVKASILPKTIHIGNGDSVIFAGFGKTDALDDYSKGILEQTTVKVSQMDYSKTEFQTDNSESGSCSGDSGGPVYVNHNSQLYLFGVMNLGDAVLCNGYGINAEVNMHMDWIEKTAISLRSGR